MDTRFDNEIELVSWLESWLAPYGWTMNSLRHVRGRGNRHARRLIWARLRCMVRQLPTGGPPWFLCDPDKPERTDLRPISTPAIAKLFRVTHGAVLRGLRDVERAATPCAAEGCDGREQI